MLLVLGGKDDAVAQAGELPRCRRVVAGIDVAQQPRAERRAVGDPELFAGGRVPAGQDSESLGSDESRLAELPVAIDRDAAEEGSGSGIESTRSAVPSGVPSEAQISLPCARSEATNTSVGPNGASSGST